MNAATGIAKMICHFAACCGTLLLCGCEDSAVVESTTPRQNQPQSQNQQPSRLGAERLAEGGLAAAVSDDGSGVAGNDGNMPSNVETGSGAKLPTEGSLNETVGDDGSEVDTKDDDAVGQSDQGEEQDQQAGGAQSDQQNQERGRAEINWDAPIEQPPEAKGLVAPFEKADVWVDLEEKKIVMAGRICQSAGFLEFFATLRGYQEHEAIVTIRTKSSFIHGLLLAIGVEPGRPVQYRPEFRAAEGPEINVTVYWTDKNGERQSAKAQDWIKNAETGKPMKHPFVFAGSRFVSMGEGEPEYYTADDGYLICVSNFPTAMLDLPIASTDANAALMFEAFEGRVPAVGTEIAVVLEPKDKPAAKADAGATDKDGFDKSASANKDG